MKLAPFALVALLLGAASASATVYSVDGTVGAGGVTGFIQTDGTVGTLSDANIQDWNLVISTDATHSLDLLGPLSGNNSQEGIFGSGLSATATGLFFDFSLPSSNYLLIQNPVLGSGTNFICLNGCAASVGIGVGDFRATSDSLEGDVQIGAATTPLPAALPLFGTGLGALALFASSRKRRKLIAAA
jgi:hypothetical protein